MANPFAIILKSFGTAFGGLGRSVGFFVTSKLGRRSLLISLVLLALLYTPIKESFKEGDPTIVLDVIVTRLASGDNGIYQEVEDLKELEPRTNWKIILSGIKILSLFYFSFYILWWLWWKVADTQNNSKDLRNIIFASIMLVLMQFTGSVYLLSAEHEGNFSQDITYIIGEKSFLETLSFVNPIKGIINMFQNIEIFLDPINSIAERIYK